MTDRIIVYGLKSMSINLKFDSPTLYKAHYMKAHTNGERKVNQYNTELQDYFLKPA